VSIRFAGSQPMNWLEDVTKINSSYRNKQVISNFKRDVIDKDLDIIMPTKASLAL